MISKLSIKIVDIIFSKQAFSDEKRELYIYCFYLIFSHLLYLALTSAFGLILNCFWEGLVFYAAFQFIRRAAGGYHASTETRCQLLSTLAIFFSILLIKISKEYDLSLFLIILTFISTLIIFFLCPLDTPEKPLSENETKYFRKKSRVILMVIFVVAMFSFVTKVNILLAPCSVSLLLEAILIVCGKIKKSTI